MLRRFPALVALLALTAALPAASGQTVGPAVFPTSTDVVVDPPESPLRVGEFTALRVHVHHTYLAAVPALSPAEVELRVAGAPPWAVATLSPSRVYATLGLGSGLGPVTATMSALLLVSPTWDAPAFQAANVRVEAFARPNGLHASSEGAADVPLMAGFFALTEASAPTDLRVPRQEAATLPVTITNFGNGMVRATLEPESVPEGVTVTLPDPLVLESRQQGGQANAKTVLVPVRAGSGFQEGELVLRVRIAYALDPAVVGDETRLEVHLARATGGDVVAQTLGANEPVGLAVQAGFLAAAVAGIALAAKRRAGP